MLQGKPLPSLESGTFRILIFFVASLVLFVAFLAGVRASWSGNSPGMISLIRFLTCATLIVVFAFAKVMVVVYFSSGLHAPGRKAIVCVLGVILPLTAVYVFLNASEEPSEPTFLASFTASKIALALLFWLGIILFDALSIRMLLSELGTRTSIFASWMANTVCAGSALALAIICRILALPLP